MPPTATQTDAPADLASKPAANAAPEQTDPADLDALRAEVNAETTADDAWPKPIPLGDVTVRVKHYLDWPLSCEEQFITGQWTLWAKKILAEDDFEKIWVPADPTLRQVLAFIKDLEVATGVPFAQDLVLRNS